MRLKGLLLLVLLLAGCAEVGSFEDRRREAGQIPTVGKSKDNRPAICYNPLWTDVSELQSIADEACARTNKKATYVESEHFTCRLSAPSVAYYTCK
jgi:hypothetical protein